MQSLLNSKLNNFSINLGQCIEYACYGYLVFAGSTILLDEQPIKLILLIIACFSLISVFSMPIGQHISSVTHKMTKKHQKYCLLTLLLGLSLTLISNIHANQVVLITLILFISKVYQGMMQITLPKQEEKHARNTNQKIILFSSACILGLTSCLLFNEIKNTQTPINYIWISITVLSMLLSTLSIKKSHRCKHNVLKIFNKAKRLFSHHKKETLCLFIVCSFTVVQITTCTIYSHLFMLRYTQITYHSVFITTIFGCISLIAILPIMCLLADKLEKGNLILMGLVGTIIAPPLLFMLDSMDLSLLRFSGHLIYALFICSTCAPLFKIAGQLIPLTLRHIALSLSFGLSIPLFGTTTTHIADEIIKTTHSLYMPGLYASMSSTILLIVILKLRKHTSYERTKQPATIP